MLETVNILGVDVKSAHPDIIVNLIDSRLEQKETTKIAFLNTNLSNVVARNWQLREELKSFIILNDGLGVDFARKILHGRQFEHNLNGTDLLPYFLGHTKHQLRVFLFGSRTDVLERAKVVISETWPRHIIVGTQNGYFEKSDLPKIASQVALLKPDLILVALGNPIQEDWISRYVPRICPCAFAVGAWFDFISGSVSRAPLWVRRSRMEWVYRLGMEPQRLWRRYILGNSQFLIRVIAARLRNGKETEKKSHMSTIASGTLSSESDRNGKHHPNNYILSWTKRSLDVVCAGAGLMLLLPSFIGIAIVIRATSPGPVIFRQRRTGRNFEPFTIYKFRTMTVEACSDNDIKQATLGDVRITRVGRFLRKASLDELPQLVNVLKGDMSLIGPRPHAVTHDEKFSKQFPVYNHRFLAKPGLSGLAQVNGARGEIKTADDIVRRLKYDLGYIREASLRTDLNIMLRTVAEVFFSRHAH